MTDSKPIEHMINEVNRLINNAFLRCRYGVYAFDSSTETIRHTHNGIECNYSLPEGIKQITKVKNELETEDIIHSLAELIFFDIAESEELGYETTEAYSFIDFEGCETYIYGACSNKCNWSKFDLEVMKKNPDGTWYNLSRLREIPFLFSSVYLSIGHMLKEIRLLERRKEKR